VFALRSHTHIIHTTTHVPQDMANPGLLQQRVTQGRLSGCDYSNGLQVIREVTNFKWIYSEFSYYIKHVFSQ